MIMRPTRTLLNRRHIVKGLGALAIGAPAYRAAHAQSPQSEATPTGAGGEFIDDRGIAVALDPVPQHVVAHIMAASALWDFGIESEAIFGPTRKADGSPENYVGGVDIENTPNLGEQTFEFDIEAFVDMDGDLLVGISYGVEDPTNIWSIRPEGVGILTDIAPIAVIGVNYKPVTTVIARYGELAARLGADLDTPELQSARSEFDTASDNLRAAIAEKPGLKVLVIAANEDMFYPIPATPADLVYSEELGLSIVTPDDEDTSGVSYEQVIKYPADLILTESRVGWFTNDQLAEHPIMSQHPAVKAGQMGIRSNTYVASYRGFVPILEQLTTTIQDSQVILDDH
ncbi:MAG TPA: hypothetical protein VNZ58_13795 [Thermomicrobiales bacterium]|nr:hypothetical protein [Thermomicrobiales bacterium]